MNAMIPTRYVDSGDAVDVTGNFMYQFLCVSLVLTIPGLLLRPLSGQLK